MSGLMLLSASQVRRIEPCCLLTTVFRALTIGFILSGIIVVLRNGSWWRDAPRGIRSVQNHLQSLHSVEQAAVFNRVLTELTAKRGKPEQLMIDASHLKAHRTAASLLKKGMFSDVLDAPEAG